MSAAKNQKLKLFYVKEILEKYTDAEHGIKMERILELLAMRGIEAERKSVYSDINLLIDGLGMDIAKPVGAEKEYRLLSREFDVSELRLIIDTLQADKFLSERTVSRLIHKLEGLCSRWEAREMQKSVVISGRVKNPAESHINIGYIHEAIIKGKQIAFRYFDYDIAGNRKYRITKTGKNLYVASPYYLIYDNGKYYMLAYVSNTEKFERLYRVDKMANILVMGSDREGYDIMSKVDLTKYEKQMFNMFGGDVEDVTLEFQEHMVGVVMDKFGHDTMLMPVENSRFRISAKVAISRQFFGWVFGLGDQVKIVGPEKVVNKYREMIGCVGDIYSRDP